MYEEHIMNGTDTNKYFRVQANIDLDAIRHNLKEMKSKLNQEAGLMAVMKADAYGHGAVTIAKYIDDSGLIDVYGVAIIEEAIELREAGIVKPILIFGYTAKEQYELVVSYDVTQTVFQYEMAEELSKEAVRQGKTAKIHIKIDTGMSRIGFSDSPESVMIIKNISNLPNIEIEGLFSHMACADETDRTSTKKQIQRFQTFIQELEQEQINIPIKHMSNSAGFIEYPEANFNMVRCGIATYGIYPSECVNHNNIKLLPAMELKTHVVYVKEVEAGIGVSYGATYVTTKRTKIATIPVGYADGYSRNLSNYGKVIIHGKYAPIIGRVCMDQFMVDVTDIDDVKQGDVVTLLGKDQDAVITVEELGAWSHSFPYELVCVVGKRVPRVYINI